MKNKIIEDNIEYIVKTNNRWTAWTLNKKIHRIKGPAVIYSNGKQRWCYQGVWTNCSNQKEFERYLKLKVFW